MSKNERKQKISRRKFIGASGAIGATLSVSNLPAGNSPHLQASGATVQRAGSPVKVSVAESEVTVETATLAASFRKGFLVSLRSRASGEEYIDPFTEDGLSPISLVYRDRERVGLMEKFSEVEARSVSPSRAEFIFRSWDGDGRLVITGDQETGDLILEPSAFSSRPGVRACRWELHRPRHDLDLVAPFFQGVKLPLEDPLIRNRRWSWPMSWEAGMAILQGPRRGGFWVHTRDSRYRYKSLQVGSEDENRVLGFDIESYGPLDDNLSAGGLRWRINVFGGKWEEPAAVYRDWLWKAYRLDNAVRQEWINNVRMAVSWCPTDLDILEAIRRQANPKKVLIHLPRWRSDPYDENYPTYQASEEGQQFISEAQKLGFRTMPHCNSIDMDPTHPVYPSVRDFQYRDLESKHIRGWSWYEGTPIGVPESNTQRALHRDKKVMVKIHPGLSMWRSILQRNVGMAAQELALDSIFLDVTLTTWNLDNCLVENMTSTEGMKQIIRDVASFGKGLITGGEGLNEIMFQELSFAQVHLLHSWHATIDGLERAGGCPLNDFLFGRLCRSFGYSNLSGSTEEHRLRHRIHLEHNAIPTITVRSAEELETPNRTVRRVLEGAK